ncbi:cytochrome d ubiquinol oxidase subunit II [Caldimonas aquatica]|uniref:Cytochrome d ubiquinol oxidase subunit II n=1 Tax=Caldimonas aquatica TaxID=376175 RepID=A0ABY6MNF4_9BURK|nr:cytochrome d ubiquinol oxidase subunit II [Schlegelella aquatica]UZD54032.1 cytochrome d ubiquinol oxidase subunit II [Schlegelella aquatica]
MTTLETVLPVIFMGLMGLAMLAYVVLDGYDLGVGMLMLRASDAEKDTMVASIGPFWDANETWLVLGVGILLIAFPKAHGVVLTALYLPTAVMLVGLILRGVAFDFRVKARAQHKPLWNHAFFAGSTLASLAQGWMLGRYVTGFAEGVLPTAFAAVIALALPAAYVLLGATWLILKTEGELQRRAIDWAKAAWVPVVLGMGMISLATPWASETVRERWFSMPAFIALLPIPLTTALALGAVRALLNSSRIRGKLCWVPFVLVIAVFVLGFFGLAYSLYPYVVMDRMTLWEAASATNSLVVILIGAAITVPAIIGYTIFAYRVFWGKATPLSYG